MRQVLRKVKEELPVSAAAVWAYPLLRDDRLKARLPVNLVDN
jgi:hypothetical protein